jgi:hypothetical protein
MLKTNRLVRGCLVLMLAGCIVVSAGAVFAVRLARASGARSNVAFNLGPVHVGNPCAQLRASYPSLKCESPYYIVVKVNGAPLWSIELPLP